MANCYPVSCMEYAVTPMLVAEECSPHPTYCQQEPESCYPCLPRCQKPQFYCCEPKAPKARHCDHHEYREHHGPNERHGHHERHERECCHPPPPQVKCCPPPRPVRCCLPPPRSSPPPPPPQTCELCCYPPPCKPVKTKYIMPCYRYEDGRIANQPTVLMRRACEIACGTRPKRKPFVESSYLADSTKEIRRYHSEDERGNYCFHFERKPSKPSPCYPDKLCCPPHPCPDCSFVDCVYARPVESPAICCYYCR